MELPVSVKLSSIYCYDEADSIGDAEPYLWTIFFKIDGETIRQNGIALGGDAVFAFGPGSHRNLNRGGVTAGESVTIPAAIGEWSTKLSPIVLSDFSNNTFTMPGIIGVAVVLMEEDNVTDSGAEAGHQALNAFVRDSINDFLHSINLLDFADPDTRKETLDAKIEQLKKDIIARSKDIVHDAIVNKQPWYSNLWSGINADDKIGSEIWIFNQDDIVKSRYHVHLNIRWKNEGDWELSGDINAPNPCQGPLIAVNQQKAKIKSIEDIIRQLQKEFREAPPAMKPALRAEIEEVKKEQLKPAQAALAPLVKALEACYARQTLRPTLPTTGTIGTIRS